MTVESNVTMHPKYDAVLKLARWWLANPNLSQNCLMGCDGPLEHELVRELLGIIDHSIPGSAHTRIQNYLDGDVDSNGETVNRGVNGLLQHLYDLAKVGVENIPKSPNIFQGLSKLIASWPPTKQSDSGGTFGISQKTIAEEIRRLLAIQGESWTMNEISDFATKLWHIKVLNGSLSAAEIAKRVSAELETGRTQQPIRNIGDAEVVLPTAMLIDDTDLNKLTAKQDLVKAVEVDDHYRYIRNDVQFTIAREYGKSPEGNPLMGAWVIRNFFTGDYIDHDRHRTDLAERHAIKLTE